MLMRPFVAPYDKPPRIPSDYVMKEARGKRGRVYFQHKASGRVQWEVPRMPSSPVRGDRYDSWTC